MKDPRALTKDQLVEIVQKIRDCLWLMEEDRDGIKKEHGKKFLTKCLEGRHPDTGYPEYYNPDKDWESEVVEDVARVLTDAGLGPTKPLPKNAGYPERTPDQCWKDDEIQFPRLLWELVGIGIIDFLKDKGWTDLEASMNLPREKIEEIFDRAERRWEKTIKEDKKP
jgi:hypothetical protein